MKKLGSYTTFIYLLISAVSGQECADTVGSLDYNTDQLPAPVDRTYILTGYIVPCNSTVVAWEYCYQISSAKQVTFYPGIWRITRTSDVDLYTLIQRNEVIFDSRGTPPNLYICSIFNVSNTEQFIAPAGSVIGVYTLSAQILRTNTDDSITVYQFRLDQNNVSSTGTDVNYNIAVRVHLLTSSGDTTTVTATTSMVSTSDTTTVTPTTSMVSTSDTTTITPTTSILSTSDTTTVTTTTSILSTSDTTTATPIPSTVSTSNTNMATIATVYVTVSDSSSSTEMQVTSPAATTTPSDVPMLNNSSDNITILIGGVVGGVVGIVILLLIVTAVLCIVHMRRCCRRDKTEEDDLIDHEYDEITDLDPATPYEVPRQTSEDERNFVQPNEQSYVEGSRRNTINPPTYEVSTGEDRVTAFSTTSDIRAHQSLSDDTTIEYDYAYAHVHAHDDQPLHHNSGVYTELSADRDQDQSFYMQNNHINSSTRSNTVYGVVNQLRSDSLDDQSNHISPSSSLHANGDEPNGSK